MSVLLFFFISYLLSCFTMAPLFKKAGIEPSKAWIPGVNFVEWCKLVGRKPTFALWMLFPIVNIFIWCGLSVDLVRSFGMHDFGSAAKAVFLAPLAFWQADKSGNNYNGPVLEQEMAYNDAVSAAIDRKDTRGAEKLLANNPYKKGMIREWAEAIFFAVFAASFIRMFLIEAYVIPTSSMEGSLLVGDFLFVSKAHYGIRMPMTIAQFPLVHNRLPLSSLESYLEKPSLDYTRMPAIESVERLTPVVFNFPEGDSVFVGPDRAYSMNDVRGLEMSGQPDLKMRAAQVRKLGLVTRPIDKRDHYIKRCVGLPGDSLQIRNSQLYINGVATIDPPGLQKSYLISMPNKSRINTKFLEDLGVNMNDLGMGAGSAGYVNLNVDQVAKVKALGGGILVERFLMPPSHVFNIFPKDSSITRKWDMENFGPIYIPKAGATVKISPKNMAFYSRIITIYEGNKLEKRGDEIFINGVKSTDYTFKQNYYWMQGDNRNQSEDSRVWGFVPEDHVVGKPLFVWMSIRSPESYANGKGPNIFSRVRWNRVFSGATRK